MTNDESTTKRDQAIRGAVDDRLRRTDGIHEERIGVAVSHGTVTVSGQLGDYVSRAVVTDTARRTNGVLAVVDDLVVHPASYVSTITETDTARRVSEAIQKITARGGAVSAGLRGTTVTLTGHVGEARQLIDLREAVAAVDGVKFVINTVDVTVPPPPNVPEVRIREGMARHGALDAEDVHVAVTGTDVTLTGRVSSWAERDQAATTAWSLPHVTRVINRITVSSWYPIPTD